MPKVSVWLTSYNHGEMLRESIESILCQTYQDFELIIMDDYSTDQSREIIMEYAHNNPRIRTIFHEKNWAHSGLQQEVEHFAGEYVAILHGDDKWQKDKLEKQVEVLERHKNIAACFTDVQAIDLEGKEYVGSQAGSLVFKSENRTRYEWLRYFFYNSNCLCHPSIMIRKSAYGQYGLLVSGALTSLPDFYQWVKLCFHEDIYILPEKLTLFRIHDDETSQSGETGEKLNRVFIEEYFIYQTYFCIDDIETLTKIFPESRQYVKDGECVIKFALARIFMEAPRNAQKLLGMNTMCELMSVQETRRKIEELYHYGVKEFSLEKQKYDIFGQLSRERFLMSTLFVDIGNGYNEQECMKEKVFIPSTGKVRIIYNIGENFPGKRIKGLRFDLDEEIYRTCTVIKALWEDGTSVEIRPVNGLRKDGEDRFYTLDPQYEIVPGEHTELQILLKVGILPTIEVERETGELKRSLEESQAKEKKYRQLLQEYRSSILIRALHNLQRKIKK